MEDADFDLEFHVRHVALPRPGDWRQLCIQTARLHARPLDPARPPWEFTVIEGLDGIEGLPGGAYAVLSKVHLAAVPALLRSQIFEALHDKVPVGAPVTPPERPWRGESAPSAPVTVALATHLTDPLQRLHHIHASRPADLKAAAVASLLPGARVLTESTRFAPTAAAGMAARLWLRSELAPLTRPRCNCVVMIIPGPQLPRYSTGARMLLHYGLGPLQDGMGLLFTAFSYCGFLTLSFTACREQLPAPADFAAALQCAFEELLQAAMGERQPGALAGSSGPAGAARQVRALSASLGHDLLVAAESGRSEPGRELHAQRTDGNDSP